jgi:hypothetical protein
VGSEMCIRDSYHGDKNQQPHGLTLTSRKLRLIP